MGKKQAYSFFKIIVHVFFLNLDHLMLQRWPIYLFFGGLAKNLDQFTSRSSSAVIVAALSS